MMPHPVRFHCSVLLLAVLLVAPGWVSAADPTSLSIRLVLARKADKPDLPASLADVAGDLKSLGYNAATVMQSTTVDVKQANTHKMTIESGFTVTVSSKPPEEEKVPVLVVWEKGGKQNKVNARVCKPFICGGGAYKDGTLFLILKAP